VLYVCCVLCGGNDETDPSLSQHLIYHCRGLCKIINDMQDYQWHARLSMTCKIINDNNSINPPSYHNHHHQRSSIHIHPRSQAAAFAMMILCFLAEPSPPAWDRWFHLSIIGSLNRINECHAMLPRERTWKYVGGTHYISLYLTTHYISSSLDYIIIITTTIHKQQMFS